MRGARGFTLLELLIALAIVAALVAIAFGGFRVAVAAWGQGEERAEAHQHLRSLATVLTRALAGAYPYRAAPGPAPEPALLFRGAADRVELVTQAPPVPAALPIAFTALVVGVEATEGQPALVVRQRPLPNHDPFSAAEPVLRDPAIQRVEFRYLDALGVWHERWDGEREDALPLAIRVTLTRVREGRAEPLPPVTVALRTQGRAR